MAIASIDGVAIRAIAAAVPAQIRTNDDIGGPSDREYVEKISSMVGVRERRVVSSDQFGSDLAHASARAVLDLLGWDPKTVDLLIVATQTPDRLFPGISFMLHRRLMLSQTTPVFDVNLGCSAFTHGLWMVASLLRGIGRRALLVNVDIMSRTLGPEDWGNQVLFGDAGTVTALEIDSGADTIQTILLSDGKGTDSVCFPFSAMSATVQHIPSFVINGPAVLGLALRSVPRLMADLLNSAGLGISDIGLFVPHQANTFILEKLSTRLEIDQSRIVIAMERFGNTSSASIPLALCARQDMVTVVDRSNTVMVGFGTGFSLSGVIANLNSTAFVGPINVA